MRRHPHIIPLGLLLALALLGAGCELKLADSDESGAAAVGCFSDADCGSGEYCVVAAGACVPMAAPSTRTLGVRVSPPSASGYAETQFARLDVSAESPLDLTLPRPRRVHGWVRTANNPLEPSVAAIVTARATGDISGATYQLVANSGKELGADRDYGYELLLPATDQYWELTVSLEREEFPPYVLPPRRFGLEEERLDVTVPSLSEYHRISGRLVHDKAIPDEALSGVRVFAHSLTSSNVSTFVELDEQGAFTLSVPPEPEGDTYRLRVEPTDRSYALPSTIIADEVFVDGSKEEGVNLGDLEMGELPRVVSARVLVVDADGAAVAGAAVRCTGAVLDGTLTDEQTSDESGAVTLKLRRGAYDCTCVPPAGGTLGARRWVLDAQADEWNTSAGADLEQVIDLAPKARLAGSVRDSSGRHALAGVSVLAVHVDPEDPLYGREIEAVTDEQGEFVLRLEPSSYTFVLFPPSGSGRPVQVVDDVTIVEGDQTRGFVLDEAMVVSGEIRGAEGEPLVGVRVEFYRVSEEDDRGPVEYPDSRNGDTTESFERLVLVIASAITDETGTYHAVLPAE